MGRHRQGLEACGCKPKSRNPRRLGEARKAPPPDLQREPVIVRFHRLEPPSPGTRVSGSPWRSIAPLPSLGVTEVQ